MLVATAKLIGVADLMFGKHVPELKADDETHEQREQRTWKQKVHLTKEGQCYLPPFALKNGLESAARWLSLKIPGEGHKTFTKRFVAGVLVSDKLLLFDKVGKPIGLDAVEPVPIFAPSDGKRGGPKRVFRIFPTIHDWQTDVVIHVFDNKITANVMERHLKTVGQFIGFGSMRVENGGINGRFAIDKFQTKTETV